MINIYSRRFHQMLFAALALLAAPLAAHAGKTMLATCTGQGAEFLLTEITDEDASLVYGLSPPPGDEAVLVVSADGGKAHWSSKSRKAIDKECGGDGKDEIALFSPIQPRNGEWGIELMKHTMDGCSPMIAKRAKAAVSQMAGDNKSHQLSFREPFHPQPLLVKAKNIHWIQTGLNTWRAVMAQSGDSSSMSFNVTLNAEVVSPTRIVETQLQHITMEPTIARMMGGSADCRATAVFNLHWVK